MDIISAGGDLRASGAKGRLADSEDDRGRPRGPLVGRTSVNSAPSNRCINSHKNKMDNTVGKGSGIAEGIVIIGRPNLGLPGGTSIGGREDINVSYK